MTWAIQPMSNYTALLDANVLYPAPLRDLLLQLRSPTCSGRNGPDIHREWIEALLLKEPHRERAKLERTRDLWTARARLSGQWL